MTHGSRILVVLCALLTVIGIDLRPALAEESPTVSFAVIGMGGGAFETLKSFEKELNVRLVFVRSEQFQRDPLPDLSEFDVVLTSFASGQLKDPYRQALGSARVRNPELKVLCVAPAPICAQWAEWVGEENIRFDPALAAYYGISRQAMGEMLRYILIKEFGRPGEPQPPDAGEIVSIYHPEFPELRDVADFLERAEGRGWDLRKAPRVALGTWRHHVLFHQPAVVDALIQGLAKVGILAVSFVADSPGFAARLREFHPDAVVMNSHTREPVKFWEELGVPRFHALWFTMESIDEWRLSNQTGMTKGALFHLVTSAEMKGSTECLTAGGTENGLESGEEILPIPDRIRRIVGRIQAWIRLATIENSDKRIAVVVWDREGDKAGLLMGPAHNLNAPRSLIRLLAAMQGAGYEMTDVPEHEQDLLERMEDHGRQMGTWEPALLDRLARSGKAILVPEDEYRNWFEELVPLERRQEVEAQWGAVPGSIMVWEDQGKRFLVLPSVSLGNVILLTQPLKGETITASMKAQTPDESLLPPTHHFLAAYFWLQNGFKADAVVHFGSHGQEWLFPGKQAVLSRYDWADLLMGNLPNINPWLSSNTSELLPCKRKANAVTVSFLPSPLTQAGLPDNLLNLESTIQQYLTLEEGALQRQFAQSVTRQVQETGVSRDLDLATEEGHWLSDEDILRVEKYLHDLGNELIPASMHILGLPPSRELRIPYLVHSMGKRYLKASAGLYKTSAGKREGTDLTGSASERDANGRARAEAVLTSILFDGVPMDEALRGSGASWEGELPAAVREGLEMAVEMNRGFDETPREIEQILAALDGKYVAPGPSGNPERNPGVLPTGHNLYLLNPEELPTRASYELGSKLMREYLEQQFETQGRYPRKIAFSLVPFATTSDFGITESQILYLMGLRPVWDSRNRVRDVEVIPSAELGRPRIDVFLSARSVYRDELPSMMRLLDKAIRLAASLDEPENWVFQNSRENQKKLEALGVGQEKAHTLSLARMFGAKPEEIIDSHNWFFYLTERSGEWENREDLLEVYLQHSKHAYAEGSWGENAPEAFDLAIMGTELIFRSWFDNRDFVLSNKFTWWVDGTLSLAVKHMTGKEPGYLFVDVRDPEEASIVDSNQVVQTDFRARLTNPKWIKGMMAEGYAGGNLIAKTVDNLMGWEIMREDSVKDSNWDDVYQVYVQDREKLGVRDWLDRDNPFAFQKVSVTMLETARKGYWQADESTRLDLAAAYADSVARHGQSGGPREGDNEKLEAFVAKTLSQAQTPEMDRLLERYQARQRELIEIPQPADPQAQPGVEPEESPKAEAEPTQAPPPEPQASQPEAEAVEGHKLERAENLPEAPAGEDTLPMWLLVATVAVLLVLSGFFFRDLFGRRKGRSTND